MIGYQFNDMKPNKLYLIYNKVWNCYKFGVTSKSIESRLISYLSYKNLKLCDIDLLFCIDTTKAKYLEKELMQLINGYRFYVDSNQPLKEHFVDKDNKLNEVITFFNNIKAEQ